MIIFYHGVSERERERSFWTYNIAFRYTSNYLYQHFAVNILQSIIIFLQVVQVVKYFTVVNNDLIL